MVQSSLTELCLYYFQSFKNNQMIFIVSMSCISLLLSSVSFEKQDFESQVIEKGINKYRYLVVLKTKTKTKTNQPNHTRLMNHMGNQKQLFNYIL